MTLIRPASVYDGEALARIYNHYVAHTIVTFEEDPVDAASMTARVHEVVDAGLPWIVLEEATEVLGYAYASHWKRRPGYRFSVESTVYLAPSALGKGRGAQLYQRLLSILEEGPAHLVIGGIALPNPASISLHERLGFEKVAHFREVGFKFEKWIDVGYWQRYLTRP